MFKLEKILFLDFQVGFTKKSHKKWINNNRDIHDALEILKTGKLTLWCISVGPNAAKKHTHARENDSESDTSDTEVSKGNGSHSTKKKKTASEERDIELSFEKNMVRLTLVFSSLFGLI